MFYLIYTSFGGDLITAIILKMNKSGILRYIGNTLLVIGYQVMLWGDFKNGLTIKFIGGLLTIPFAIKLKLWDILLLCAFFSFTELSKLIKLYGIS